MKKALLFVLAITCIACSKPDPYDTIRGLRRGYELKVDLTVDQNNEVRYEIKARNLTGKQELQDITAIVYVGASGEDRYWEKKVEIDVSGTGPYATATLSGVEKATNEKAKDYEVFDVYLAPDNEGSGFESYREFMRVAK